MSRTVILLLGLIALALLFFLCIRKHTPVIQEDIQTRTSTVLSSVPTDWTHVAVDGRNVTLTGIAPTEELREKAADMARAVAGVVSVDNQITVAKLTPVPVPDPEPVAIQSPYKSLFTKTTSGIILSGLVPDEEHRQTLLRLAEAKFGAENVTDNLEIGAGAPESWLQVVTSAITNLGLFNKGTASISDTQIELSGEVIDGDAKNTIETELQKLLPDNFKVAFDLIVPQRAIEEIHPKPAQATDSSCSEQFSEKLTGQVIHFSTDSAGVDERGLAIIDKILQFSAACPNSIIEVAGHADARGSDSYNVNLSKNRAQAIVDNLIKRGMRAGRLKVVGYGEANPRSNNNTRKGQADNRRIEFSYLQEGE